VIASQFPSVALLAEVDLVKLLSNSRGIVLGVVIILILLMALCAFVVFYKLIHITQAQAQSIRFLDRFWESRRLD
jgi:biopolymer transport protein TolQ